MSIDEHHGRLDKLGKWEKHVDEIWIIIIIVSSRWALLVAGVPAAALSGQCKSPCQCCFLGDTNMPYDTFATSTAGVAVALPPAKQHRIGLYIRKAWFLEPLIPWRRGNSPTVKCEPNSYATNSMANISVWVSLWFPITLSSADSHGKKVINSGIFTHNHSFSIHY